MTTHTYQLWLDTKDHDSLTSDYPDAQELEEFFEIYCRPETKSRAASLIRKEQKCKKTLKNCEHTSAESQETALEFDGIWSNN